MATEVNKEKEFDLKEIRMVVGKASEADQASIKAAFGNIINAIKAVHLG